MESKESRKKKLKKKLLHKYRLVILNEKTFEERLSFKLTRLNVFIFGSLLSILLVVGTILLIAFTPLREYVPGYSSSKLKKESLLLLDRTDSLEKVIYQNKRYMNSIKKVLTGEVEDFSFEKGKAVSSDNNDITVEDLAPSKEDSLFREAVENEEKYNVFETAENKVDFVFFTPATGTITQKFDPQNRHYAIDVALKKDAPIKAIADGTVIFSEWTAETGYVITLAHQQGFISVYKHNGQLHKQQGDNVKSGEVIALAGSTGEHTTGPHMHFELWQNGYPIDAIHFIDFE